MEKLIREYRDRLWWAATGEGPETAFIKYLELMEDLLRQFALKIVKECGDSISDLKDGCKTDCIGETKPNVCTPNCPDYQGR